MNHKSLRLNHWMPRYLQFLQLLITYIYTVYTVGILYIKCPGHVLDITKFMSMDGTVLDVPSMDIVPSHYQHCQPVLQHIDLLLLSGICMHRISKHNFFVESAMKMTKVAISNYGRMIFMIYREMLLCQFIIYTVNFYLANLQ